MQTSKPYRGTGGVNPRTYVSRELARGMFASEMLEAEERGRQAAVIAMLTNPESRARVENTFGLAYARNRYPEVYVK